MERAASLFVSPRGAARVAVAQAFLAALPRSRPLLVLGAHPDAGVTLLRRATARGGATFGWERRTLGQLAAELGGPRLASEGRTVAGPLVLEALSARVVADAHAAGRLGRFARVHDRPGLVRALARTALELRLASVSPAVVAGVDPTLGALLSALDQARADAGLADRADLLRAAAGALAEPPGPRWRACLLLDLAADHHAERALVEALLRPSRLEHVLATAPAGSPEVAWLSDLLGGHDLAPGGSSAPAATCLDALQEGLFGGGAAPRTSDGTVDVRSAPGEARECTEIARILLHAAAAGVPFERMAVLLRAPASYRAPLEEALGRAGIPASFARGAVRPDPAGRAFLALLACADDGLSARRFAEYLSLGQVPRAAPAEDLPSGDFVPGDDELAPSAVARDQAWPSAGAVDSHLPAPRRWEALLVEASVLGGLERWQRRLDGLAASYDERLAALDDDEREGSRGKALEADRAHLAALRAFALPCIERLAALPSLATWGEWIEQLQALARATLGTPERVLGVLAELAPMAGVGPVHLSEVRLVLAQRLGELTVAPSLHAAGAITVAPIDHARGTSFDLVIVPGLVERGFPQKLVEDPILLDPVRAALAASQPGVRLGLADNALRAERERVLLRLAVGAAEHKILFTYPRVDAEQGRARVPSFYALEVVRAAEGAMLDFEALARRAEGQGTARARLGWPAPDDPLDAIDEAEHDLAVLARLRHLPPADAKGAARFLLEGNPHLARGLRARARLGLRRWTSADGLVAERLEPSLAAVLATQRPGARPFSPTALQHFAACPYRFFLSALLRLEPREVPEPIEELDPLERGALVHAIHFRTLVGLRDEGLLPLGPGQLERATVVLDGHVAAVATEFAERLAPAIGRVWDDAILSIRADAREWLRRLADPVLTDGFHPVRFELSFGLPGRDPATSDTASTEAPVQLALPGGRTLLLRGSIDLVERDDQGRVRATDYKTGKTRASADAVVGGGRTLQPVLYALALEQLVGSADGAASVVGGRLYYCTSAGEFGEVFIPLDTVARERAAAVVGAVDESIDQGFLPRAPARGECEFCDFRAVCGPGAEARGRRKPNDKLVRLEHVRGLS